MSNAAGNAVLTGVSKEGSNLAGRSAQLLKLTAGNRPFSAQAASSAIRNAVAKMSSSAAGQQAKTLADRMKNNKLVIFQIDCMTFLLAER